MDARYVSSALLVLVYFSLGANFSTRNFSVTAPDARLARQVAEQAEKYRQELAVLWLGRELPDWPQRCPIRVQIAAHAGGETSFAFVPTQNGTSQPVDWRMKIFGPPDRLLDSVLPHEVTHTIFATHFGRPLPRWADEGACTTVEHAVEKRKNHRMLIEFLTNNRGIPFNHMFAMKQYPHDILPLYSQGYSVSRYLIMQKGPKHFVNYVGEGMKRERPGREPQTWNQVTKEFYGFDNLSDLQLTWLDWVRQGSPNLSSVAQSAPSSADPVRSEGNIIPGTLTADRGTTTHQSSDPKALQGESWYLQQMRGGGSSTMRRPTKNSKSSEIGYRPGSIGATSSSDRFTLPETVWR